MSSTISYSKYQVIFLIDLNVASLTSEAHLDTIRSSMLTSAVTILTNLSASTPSKLGEIIKNAGRSSGKLLWGYKFYNSACTGLPRESFNFRDFNSQQFECFENDLEKRLDFECSKLSHNKSSLKNMGTNRIEKDKGTSERKKSQVITNSTRPSLRGSALHNQKSNYRSKTNTNNSCSVGSKSSKVNYLQKEPVNGLKNSLQELLHDFPWDCPDICSPIKFCMSSKNSTLAQRKDTNVSNFVFTFSFCPSGLDQLLEFCGIETLDTKSISSHDIVKCFMPAYVFHEFYDIKRIKMFWINLATDFTEECDEQNLDGVLLMNEALGHLDGCVVPVNSILPPTSRYLTYLPKLLHSVRDEDSTMELSSPDRSLYHYTDGISGPLISSSQILNFYLTPARLVPDDYKHLRMVLTMMKGPKQQSVQVPIQLEPLVDDKTECTGTKLAWIQKQLADSAVDVINDTDSLKDDCLRDSRVIAAEKTTTICIKPCFELRVVGVASSQKFLWQLLDSSIAFHVVSVDKTDEKILGSFVRELASNQLIAIVECMSSSGHIPEVAILQPLTAGTMSLSFLGHQDALLARKRLHSEDQNGTSLLDGLLQEIPNRIYKQFIRDQSNSVSDTETNHDLQAGPPNAGTFQSSCLEPWFVPNVYTQTADRLLDFLDIGPEETDLHEKRQALKKIQKLYIERKSMKFGVCHRTKNTTLRTSPRKSVRTPQKEHRTPLKSRPKTPRRSSTRKTPCKSRTPKSNISRILRKHTPRRTPRKTPRKKDAFSHQKKKASRKVNQERRGGVNQQTFHNRSQTAPSTGEARSRKLMIDPNSRASAIMRRSKQARTVKTEQKPELSDKMKDDKKAAVKKPQQKEFKTDEELKEFLMEQYEEVLCEKLDTYNGAKRISTTVVWYYKTKEATNPQESARNWMKINLLLSPSAIRDKYSGKDGKTTADVKCREYQLQIVLNMEVEAICIERLDESQLEDNLQDLVAMLRAMSFLRDCNVLSSFLSETLLHNYTATLPKLLANIYEELLQPMPEELQGFVSPILEDAVTSVAASQSVESSSSECSSLQPPSTRTLRDRKLIRHPTFHLAGQRQIALPAQDKPRTRSSARGTTKASQKEQGSKTEVKKVRRNLFNSDAIKTKSKLERRQSVAVMENMRTPTKRKALNPTTMRTPKAHHVLKTKLVAETPKHKQRGMMVWRQQERAKLRSQAVADGDVMDIMESPDKALQQENALKSPRRMSGQLLRRKSFYSAAPEMKSRNVEKFVKYDKLEARMAKQLLSPTLKSQAQVKKLFGATTPRRIQAKKLFSQRSPSPSRCRAFDFKSPGIGDPASPLDSPSRNLRSMTPVKALRGDHTNTLYSPSRNLTTRTPVKIVSDRINALDSPSRNLRSRTPIKTLFGDQVNELVSPGRNLRSRTPIKTLFGDQVNELVSPGRNLRLRTPIKTLFGDQVNELVSPGRNLRFRTPIKTLLDVSDNPAVHRSPAHRDLMRLMSPGKQSPLRSLNFSQQPSPMKLAGGNVFMSPTRKVKSALQGSVNSPRKPITTFLDSPSKNTRSSVSSNDNRLTSPRGNCGSKSSFTSPSSELKSPLEAAKSSINNVSSGQTFKSNLQISSSPSLRHCHRNIQVTPPRKQRKIRVKTPDSLDKWPRKKPRLSQNTSPASNRTHIAFSVLHVEEKISSEARPERTTRNSCVLKENQMHSESKNQNLDSSSFKQGAVADESDKKLTACHGGRTPKFKRKRSPLYNSTDSIENSVPDLKSPVLTPRKRTRRTSLRNDFWQARSSDNSHGVIPDYFSSSEVFLSSKKVTEQSNLADMPCDSGTASNVAQNADSALRYNLRRLSSSESNAKQDQSGEPQSMPSWAVDSASNMSVPSPVFDGPVQNDLVQKTLRLDSLGRTQSNGSGSESPVFTSGEGHPKSHPLPLTYSPALRKDEQTSPKNFSPITSNGVKHLMTSPFVSKLEVKSPQRSHDRTNVRSRTVAGSTGDAEIEMSSNRRQFKSRRSLYRTETKSQITP